MSYSFKDSWRTLSILAVISIIFCSPILRNFDYWGQMDWDQFIFWNAVPRKTILQYHQFPLWNPYTNGGNVLLAHTNSLFLSPFYILILIFGPIGGVKLEIVLYLLIGMFGMFSLSKYMEAGKSSCYLVSFVYMLSSIYTLHLAEGHGEFMHMAFVPWLFLFYFKSLKDPKYIIGSICLLAIMILGGSIDVLAITIILISLYAFFTMLQTKRIIPLKALGTIFIGAFLLSSIKLVPMLEFLKGHPRKTESKEATEISLLPVILLSRDQEIYYRNTKWTSPEDKIKFRGRKFEYGWHEYGAYIGFLPLVLALIGLSFYSKRHWPLLTSGMLSLWISLGRGAPYNLWGLVHKLPLYNSFNVPSRFILGFIFCISLFAGFGLTRLECISNKRLYKFLINVIVGFVLIDLFLVNYPLLRATFTERPQNIKQNLEFRQRYRDLDLFPGIIRSSMYPAFLTNSGILRGYEVLQLKRAKVLLESDPNYRGEVYFRQDKGIANIVYFSPNKVIVAVDVQDADMLILNQNYYTGWKVRKQHRYSKAMSEEGLVATRVEPGNYKVIFYYLPYSFIMGASITFVTVIFLMCRFISLI